MTASLGNFETPKFETLGEIGDARNRTISGRMKTGASGECPETGVFYLLSSTSYSQVI